MEKMLADVGKYLLVAMSAFGIGLLSKIVWTFLSTKPSNERSVAEDGVVTLSFLDGHCGKEQTKCLKSLETVIKGSLDTVNASFSGVIKLIDQRLTQGDKMFNEIRDDIKEHRRDMIEHKLRMEKQYGEFVNKIEKQHDAFVDRIEKKEA